MYTCKYGHVHRTETAVKYCHVATPWREKIPLFKQVRWNPQGTTEVWCDLGTFRDLFWGAIRAYIIERDRVCQYDGCIESEYLEVHHIIPRRCGGTDHPANLISLCHAHHKIQPAHHYNHMGLVLCDADIPKKPLRPRHIRQPRPESETTLLDY